MFRYSAAGEVLWPIGMHMILVADLALEMAPNIKNGQPDPWLEVHALLHDATEICVSDVPRPMKTDEARAVEDALYGRICASLGVPPMTPEIKAAVKEADFRAALAEGSCGIAGRGYAETQTKYGRDESAIKAVENYLIAFEVSEALLPDGLWSLMYERSLRDALRVAQHSSVSYPIDVETWGANRDIERSYKFRGILKSFCSDHDGPDISL